MHVISSILVSIRYDPIIDSISDSWYGSGPELQARPNSLVQPQMFELPTTFISSVLSIAPLS